MVKDEADFIERVVTHMHYHCDQLLIADNGSTDGTRELLEALPCEVVDDDDPAYYQSAKMTKLARIARLEGAKWVVPFDADELWVGRDARERISDLLGSLPEPAVICDAAIIDHVATPGAPEMPYRRTTQLPLRKVACRAVEGLVIEQGNHGAVFPDVEFPLRATDCLRVHHYPYRSPEQFIRKARNGAAAYAATDLDESVGAHWRGYGKLSDDELRELFYKWFYREHPEMGHVIDGERQDALVLDPAPRRLVRV